MDYDIHAVANALNARSTGLGYYTAYCPVCQATAKERRKSRKLSIRQGRVQRLLIKCWRGCDYEDLRDIVEELMARNGVIEYRPETYVADVKAHDDEERRRLNVVKCIAEQELIPANKALPVMQYCASKGIPEPPYNWYWCEEIIGAEGLQIPEPHRPCLVVMCYDRDEGLPIGGQRILLTKNGERACNYSGAKFAKFSFGFLRGNPFRTTMYPACTTKALLVTESAETAAVLHHATNGGEAWGVFGVSNFKTIILRDPPISRKRPIIFFPDRDPVGSQAYSVVRDAVEFHEKKGYSVFIIEAPEAIGSKNNFTDSCAKEGIDYVRQIIAGEIRRIKERLA